MKNKPSSKWIEIAAADLPAKEVARDALRARLEHVVLLLPAAADQASHEDEPIHLLRVACRRGAAALSSFRPLIRSKRKSLEKWLRRIRRSAGPARDADVLRMRLEEMEAYDSAVGSLLARLKKQRKTAQRAVVKMDKKVQSGKFALRMKQCLDAFGEPAEMSAGPQIGQFAQAALSESAEAFFQIAKLRQDDLQHLHQLRIAGKTLRYGIELYHAVFPPALRGEVYPQIEEIQERLGGLNDHVTAEAQFQQWLDVASEDDLVDFVIEQIGDQRQAASACREAFFAWLSDARLANLEAQMQALIRTVGQS